MVEEDLNKHLDKMKNELKLPHMKYVTVTLLTHLIEVKPGDVKKLPGNWIKINGTKSVSRFRSPESIDLLKELNLRQEQLMVKCDEAYRLFLANIRNHLDEYRELVRAVSQLDCLMSLAAVSSYPNYCRAQFVDEPCIEVEQGRHPSVEQMISSYVPNDVHMTASINRALIITGPNMGGKSSYVRQVALLAIMAQIGCYVPAKSATIGILDAVYTRMGAYDNILSGESTFMVELKECSEIMKSATSRSLVILDEIGRGTGTMDGVAIAHSVLSYFITDITSLTLFITHYPMLSTFEIMHPSIVSNYHMGFVETINDDGSQSIAFLYTLERGVSHRSYGLAQIPEDIITTAGRISSQLENDISKKTQIYAINKRKDLLYNALKGNDMSKETIDYILRSLRVEEKPRMIPL